MKDKRYHPYVMLFELGSLIKNSFFIVLYLFVFQWKSTSNFVHYGRLAFYLFLVISLIAIVWRWFSRRYELDDHAFHLYKGLMHQKKQSIPYSKVQNHSRHTSLFHKLLHVTSLRFETGISGEEAAIVFKVVTIEEADRIVHLVTGQAIQGETDILIENEADESRDVSGTETSGLDSSCTERIKEEHQPRIASPKRNTAGRTIHFRPTRKDIIKASFTSLSFLVLLPLLVSFYFKLDEMFHVEEEAEGVFIYLLESWWMLVILIAALVLLSLAFGLIRTFLIYGKYEISSDASHIFIVRGLIQESSFSIAKDKVQAVEIEQSFMKRILGLAEVRLTSAGDLSFEDEKLKSSSLYPYLPVKQAYAMIKEILPAYEVNEHMYKLPNASIWVRLARPSWIWMIATGSLIAFKPSWFGYNGWWWVLSCALLLYVLVSRIMDFKNTRYVLSQHFVQFKTGSWSTKLFISKRNKIIEIKVSSNPLQRRLGLASLGTINRGKPVYHAKIEDVPNELSVMFLDWYKGRTAEIEIKT